MSWLKGELENILLIYSTLETSHELISWLKDDSENIPLISVTLETSHNSIPEKSLLYLISSFPINSLLISVIFEVSISPRQTLSFLQSFNSSSFVSGWYLNFLLTISFEAVILGAFKLCFEFFSSISSIELLFKEPFESVIPSSLKRWFTRFSMILSRSLLTVSSSSTASL